MTYSYLNRRDLIVALSGTGLLAALPLKAAAQVKARLVIVGGGFGGATAARFLKTLLPSASVTLIEANREYYACPFSNLVVAGLRELSAQRFSYEALKSQGIRVVQDHAMKVDPVGRSVQVSSGQTFDYDKLILSPGIDFRWNEIEGYDEAAAEIMPHAWKAGQQTTLLQQQLSKMKDGGVVVMSVPPAPFRCPPGPYERASLIAQYLKTHKPASKLIILDAQDKFSKQPLFEEAWSSLYPDHIERYGASEFGRVVSVSPSSMTLSTEFEDFQADVANVIPPQQAGAIAHHAGVADMTGWCPIDPLTFASTLQPDIHVIGDATIASPMPKSAFSANLQAKLCAMQIARVLAGDSPQPTTLTNTCYSYLSDTTAVSITGVYTNSGGALHSVEGAGGLSPLDAYPIIRQNEALQAKTWFRTITEQTFG
ncbi:FCSD flavin-binding domain-containing protein [Hyphomonas sp.]|uniref:FCSD flavin-binding domain-containing protein n=1 Tax=Hyphomonas sp. TaxID=87 RepID=UPI003528C438